LSGAGAELTLPHEVRIWLDRLAAASAASDDPNAYPDGIAQRILYAITCDRNAGGAYASVRAFQVRTRQDGSFSKPQNHSLSQLAQSSARFILPIDRDIGRLAALAGLAYFDARIEGEYGVALLERLVATGRCYFGTSGTGTPLRKGTARAARIEWTADAKGTQRCILAVEPSAQTLLPLAPPYYIDSASGECGPVEAGLPARIAEALAYAPPIPVEAAAIVTQRLAALAPGGELPVPRAVTVRRLKDVQPLPVLNLFSMALEPGYPRFGDAHHGARLSFRYGDKTAKVDGPAELRSFADGTLELVERNRQAEQARAQSHRCVRLRCGRTALWLGAAAQILGRRGFPGRRGMDRVRARNAARVACARLADRDRARFRVRHRRNRRLVRRDK